MPEEEEVPDSFFNESEDGFTIETAKSTNGQKKESVLSRMLSTSGGTR